MEEEGSPTVRSLLGNQVQCKISVIMVVILVTYLSLPPYVSRCLPLRTSTRNSFEWFKGAAYIYTGVFIIFAAYTLRKGKCSAPWLMRQCP